MLVRYVLLTLLTFRGLVHTRAKTVCRSVAIVVIMGVAASHLVDHVRLLGEYVAHRPERDLDRLSRALVERDVRYAYADYWTAYDVTFTSGLRVIATPPRNGDRIHRFSDLLDEHRTEAYSIRNEPCPGGERLLAGSLRAAEI